MTTKTPNIRMVDTIGQYEKIKDEINEALTEVLNSGQYINGPYVRSFTAKLEEYLDVKRVIPCANGTDALQIALMALGLKPGDEVITTAFTFIATAEVISLLNLKTVFVDIDPNTYNMDVSKIEAAITPNTKCIIPVHLYGQPCDMEPIMEIAEKHNLFVVEDGAQSIGANYTFKDGTVKKAGTIGHIGTTSFYPSKNLGAYGDGGAIFTNDEALGDKIKMICNHGSKVRYYHEEVGVNSRLDSMQAAVLQVKLKYLDEYNGTRNQAADTYDRLFADVEGVITPARAHNGTHAFHQYTLRLTEGRAKRDAMRELLAAENVPAMIYYPVPLHLQQAFQTSGFGEGSLPITEQLTAEVISLPIHSELDTAQVEYIVKKFIECLNK